MTFNSQLKDLPRSSSIPSRSTSPFFTNRRLSKRTPDSLTSSTLHGAESEPRCNRPTQPTSTRACLRLKPMTNPPIPHHNKRMDHAETITEMLKASANGDSHLFHTFARSALPPN